VARRLVASELFSGWGLRTLATSNRGYRPVSYHVGSVWPHDTALAAAGLARAGFADEALLLTRGLVAAAPLFADRLPELFCGFPRDRFGFPVAYPTTSSPQAWAAASVLLVVRSCWGWRATCPTGAWASSRTCPGTPCPLACAGCGWQGADCTWRWTPTAPSRRPSAPTASCSQTFLVRVTYLANRIHWLTDRDQRAARRCWSL
jgi:hypothetical protein